MGNRKKNGERSATSSSEELWDPAEEVAKKLVQAKGVIGAMMHMDDMDEIVREALWAAESLIEDAEKAFKEFRSSHPDLQPMATDKPTATPESESDAFELAHVVLSLPPRERALVERMLQMLKNWPPDRPLTYTEFLQIFEAAGASPADIARVSEAPKEVQS
jgi:hypothetical protein